MVRSILCCALCVLMLSGVSAVCRAQPAPYALPNGLRVVMRERHASPLIAIDLWVQAGAREEGVEEGGSAHFLEHTLFKGTRTRRAGETDSDIENLGATLNAATGPDYAHFYTTVAADHLEAALAVLADIVRNATLPAAEIERERGVILDELAQNEANPTLVLLDALYGRAFRKHPYRHAPGGTPEQIRSRRRDTLTAFYKRVYTPERCTLSLVGDFTPERARAAALLAFGDWPRSPKANEAPSLPSPIPTPQPPTLAPIPRGISRGRVGIAFPAPPASEAIMACAAQVTLALLGESDVAGRLADARLNGTESAARYTPRRDVSLFVVSAALPDRSSAARQETSAETESRLNSLENALRVMVKSLQTTPPSAAEIANAKRRVQGRLLFDQETNAGAAWAIGYAEIVGGPTPEQYRAQLQQLTGDDLQRFFQRYLDPNLGIPIHLLPATASSGTKRQ